MVLAGEKAELIKVDYEGGLTYRELAKKHRMSLRDISIILKGEKKKSAVEDEECEELKPLVSRLIRSLGVGTPTEALKQADAMVMAMNPYVLYHGVKTPKDLVDFFEDKISTLSKEKAEEIARARLETRNQTIKTLKDTFAELDDAKLANARGLNKEALCYYAYALMTGFRENIFEYFNQVVSRYNQDKGYRLRYAGRETYWLTCPDGGQIPFEFSDDS